MNNNSAYYTQTRNGKRVRVRKGRNRLNIYNGTKVKRAVGRGSIAVKGGEIYGKGVVSVGDRSSSIKKTQGIAISKENGGVKITGRVGSVKGGLVIANRKGRKIDNIAYSNDSNVVAEFSGTYKRRNKNGKVYIVRKGDRRRAGMNLVRGGELLGTAGGLLAGAKLGEKATKLAGVNGGIRNTAMIGGGLAGGAIALMLADRLEQKYGK